MCEKFDFEKCYRIAIEERARHQQNYNHWMNMYAIFNGALLVAFTSSKFCFFKILISFLGVLTSILWVLSVYGYYDWIISWIKVVSFYEAKLKMENDEKVYIYRLFSKTKKKFPFSNQKCTKLFTIFVLVGWIFLVSYEIVSIFIKLYPSKQVLMSFLPLVFFLSVFIFFCIKEKLREDLTKTHKNLKKNQDDQLLDSEIEEIGDF